MLHGFPLSSLGTRVFPFSPRPRLALVRGWQAGGAWISRNEKVGCIPLCFATARGYGLCLPCCFFASFPIPCFPALFILIHHWARTPQGGQRAVRPHEVTTSCIRIGSAFVSSPPAFTLLHVGRFLMSIDFCFSQSIVQDCPSGLFSHVDYRVYRGNSTPKPAIGSPRAKQRVSSESSSHSSAPYSHQAITIRQHEFPNPRAISHFLGSS